MAFFDQESLFTDIPLDKTINICVENIFDMKKIVKGLSKKDFRKILTFAVKSSCFAFSNVFYQQIDGVAMGPFLGPTLVDLFFVYYETKWLINYYLQFKPKYCRGYVVDIS